MAVDIARGIRTKARLLPVYFQPGRDDGFDRQLSVLHRLLGDRAELLAPVALGQPLPESEAVVFPQLLGEAYRQVDAFRAIDRPILIVTSEFGTLSMWDWEIMTYLQSQGVKTIAPYNIEQTLQICNALSVRQTLRQSTFLVYQDNPGEGAQASIFKRFYWWEDECSARIREHFGVTVVKKSLKELGGKLAAISDADADAVRQSRSIRAEGVSERAMRSAIKLYLAVKRDVDADPSIFAVGMNCLNESHFLDATPCLAWSLLHEDRGLVWGCEADTMSMLTQCLLQDTVGAPLMMTNLYPFLLGDAATKHERIPSFPKVDEPENHLLVAHCGYFGMVPPAYAADWTLRKKVLAIVDENATAIDARFAQGDVTLAKLHPTMKQMTIAEGTLTRYSQHPGSDCLNGGLIRVRDGRRLIDALASHHYMLLAGRQSAAIRLVGKVFGISVDEVC
jgi:hypothetical protein